MFNITKISGGFEMNSMQYELKEKSIVHNNTQCVIETNKGYIFLDTNITIDEKSYENVNDMIDYLQS